MGAWVLSFSFSFSAQPWVVQVAIVAACLALAVTGMLVLLIGVRRLMHERHASVQEVVAEDWRPLMLRAVAGDLQPGELSALQNLGAAQRQSFMLLWLQFQDTLRGNAQVGLNHLAAGVGLHQHALHMLQHATSEDRLVALLALGHLARASDWPSAAKLLGDPNAYVSMAAARVLLRIDPAQALTLVLDQYLSRVDWPVPRLATLLRELPPDSVTAVLRTRLEAGTTAQQLRLMPLVRVTAGGDTAALVDDLLAQASEPAMLATLLAQVSNVTSRERVLDLTQHPDDQVRAYAAAALGRMARRLPSTVEPHPKATAAPAATAPARGPLASGARLPRLRRGQPRLPMRAPVQPAPSSSPGWFLQGQPIITDESVLMRLITDPAWAVRHQAAHSLVHAPGVAERDVQRWYVQLQDPFARDILNQAWFDVAYDRGLPTRNLSAEHVQAALPLNTNASSAKRQPRAGATATSTAKVRRLRATTKVLS